MGQSQVRYDALPTQQKGPQQSDLLDPTRNTFALGGASEAVLAALSWATCSIGMTLLNKLSVSKSGSPFGVVLVQMAVTCVAAVATRNLHFGEGTRRWAISVPALFVVMMVTSMLALQHVRVGTFVVVRNVAPIITLFAEAALHPESAPRTDLYTVGALSCIALGILFYEMHDLGGSTLGLGLLLLNMAVASLERLLQRRLLAVEVVDVSKPAMMLLNNAIGFMLTAVVAAFVPGEYDRLRRIFAENKDQRALYVCASALVAVGISSSGLWFQSHVTATTFMVAGGACKGLLIVAGIAFFADTSQPAAVLGAVASLVGSFAYASQQRSASRPPDEPPPTTLTASVVLIVVCGYLTLAGDVACK
mmetsp:Transcript_21976/g.44891  ORF Transcript_21976/g.44891 Transcript_21976/m.44891 type:complete len:363 (-) Transcript_21976:136-1224(-)